MGDKEKFRELMRFFGMTPKEIALTIGVNQNSMRNYLYLNGYKTRPFIALGAMIYDKLENEINHHEELETRGYRFENPKTIRK